MSIEEQEELLDLMNHTIIRRSKIIDKIPIQFIKIYFVKRLTKYIQKRDDVFRHLREDTRKKYPERFSTQEALKNGKSIL